MLAHRTSRCVSSLRFNDRFAGLDSPVGVPDAAGPFLPFAPFRAQPNLLFAALSVKPPAFEYPLPLAQRFRRFRITPWRRALCIGTSDLLTPAQENTP